MFTIKKFRKMTMTEKIIQIIPARGGSKGLPRKNIRLLAGKPLIVYSIEAALNSKYTGRIIVSTEDEEIAELSRHHGAEIIERPAELAKDEIPTIDVVLHVLEELRSESYEPDIIVLLQPTSPLRSAQDIENALELYLDSDTECMVSVCEGEHSPYQSLTIEQGYLTPIFEEKYFTARRQDLPLIYRPNGAIYITTPGALYNDKTFYGPNILPYIMPPERSIDIDCEMDLIYAELLIRKHGIG